MGSSLSNSPTARFSGGWPRTMEPQSSASWSVPAGTTCFSPRLSLAALPLSADAGSAVWLSEGTEGRETWGRPCAGWQPQYHSLWRRHENPSPSQVKHASSLSQPAVFMPPQAAQRLTESPGAGGAMVESSGRQPQYHSLWRSQENVGSSQVKHASSLLQPAVLSPPQGAQRSTGSPGRGGFSLCPGCVGWQPQYHSLWRSQENFSGSSQVKHASSLPHPGVFMPPHAAQRATASPGEGAAGAGCAAGWQPQYHSLWRSQENFSGSSRVKHASSLPQPAVFTPPQAAQRLTASPGRGGAPSWPPWLGSHW